MYSKAAQRRVWHHEQA